LEQKFLSDLEQPSGEREKRPYDSVLKVVKDERGETGLAIEPSEAFC